MIRYTASESTVFLQKGAIMMSYRIAVFETKNDANGRPRSRLVGVLDEPVLSRYTLNRLILRRETELYRLRLLRDS